jgi:zinc D-Ala-D-Ala dipeptidase
LFLGKLLRNLPFIIKPGDKYHLKDMDFNIKFILALFFFFIPVVPAGIIWVVLPASADGCAAAAPDEIEPNYLPDSVLAYYAMLESLGYVDISEIDSSISIDLKYATEDNFMGRNMYGHADRAYAPAKIARALIIAQNEIKSLDSSLSLILFDAARPRSVQRYMWENSGLIQSAKSKFIANPASVSMHNMGLAVDVSIVHDSGEMLDMGTGFDHAGELAYPFMEEYFAEIGALGHNHVNNREILRSAMSAAGFNSNKYEWWHFSMYSKSEAIARYHIIESFSSYSLPDIVKYHIAETDSSNLFFAVQLAASERQMRAADLCAKNAVEYIHQGLYKYYTGRYASLSGAYSGLDSLKKQGCRHGFVIAFVEGQRIDIKQALMLSDSD